MILDIHNQSELDHQ